MDSNAPRRAFTQYFIDRGHTSVRSAGLIRHHPGVPVFSNAGMNQFIPYFFGEEVPPFPRATSFQKCVRIRGEHVGGEDASKLDEPLDQVRRILEG